MGVQVWVPLPLVVQPVDNHIGKDGRDGGLGHLLLMIMQLLQLLLLLKVLHHQIHNHLGGSLDCQVPQPKAHAEHDLNQVGEQGGRENEGGERGRGG